VANRNPWDVSTQEITLERQMFNYALQLDEGKFNRHNTIMESYALEGIRHHMLRFQHQVYCGKPQKETHEVKYPATWWDSFKLAYPRLCKFCKPVTYTIVKITWEGKAAFPKVPLMDGQYRHFAIWNNPIEELLCPPTSTK
jgi:hypothetical protein